jgi:hypothetical protein
VKILFAAICFLSASAVADEILSDVPAEINSDTRYLFYLHGQIVENEGLRPTHPRWGLYDYPLILETLAEDGITVISERRAKGTVRDEYAKNVNGQVRQLLNAGVEPNRITVLGFSAGGMITIVTSAISAEQNINFVIMAACSDWLESANDLSLNGRVLSVFETTDGPQSCGNLAARSPGPTSFDEIEINTGKGHGAFYLPRDEWVKPVLEWVRSR